MYTYTTNIIIVVIEVKGLFEKLRDSILSALFARNKNKNLIESANAKVRANIPNSGSLISTANLRGLSFCERDNNKQGK